jgi:hypothetical protein
VVAVAGEMTLRLANVPSDDMFSEVLRDLGAELTLVQHEMQLGVGERTRTGQAAGGSEGLLPRNAA